MPAVGVLRLMGRTIVLAALLGPCIGPSHHAMAAPARSAKLKLIAFNNSPFPYEGQPPGRDKPFLDVEKDGRRGHTARGGTVYWEDANYSDRRSLLFIPKGFDPARPGLIVVYLHGNQSTLERDVWRRQEVPRQVALSGLNAVLLAPQFAVEAWDSSPGQFWEPRAFHRYLIEAAEHLARLFGDPWASGQFDALGIVIVAYSGGYYPLNFILQHGDASGRLRGIIMLDALYGEFDTYLKWVTGRGQAFFFSAYAGSAREGNQTFQKLLSERSIAFATAMPPGLVPGSLVFVAGPDEIQHKDFLTKAWVDDPLKAVLARIPGYPRTPPPKATRKR